MLNFGMFVPVRQRARPATNIGGRIRSFREAAGLTQEVIARRARLAAKYISEIENGHANPTIGVVTRLVEQGLGIPLAGFFSEAAPGELRDDLARLAAMFSAQPVAVRRRALRVLRALCDD